MGFKDLSRFNDALLAKQTWRLLHDKTSLFYRVFKSKFFPNNTIMEAANSSSVSYAWHSIIRGREVIKKGPMWRIGDGQFVDIWKDSWLPRKYSPRVLSPQPEAWMDAKVSALIDEGQKQWRTEVLENMMLGFEAEIIRTIPLCRTTSQMSSHGLIILKDNIRLNPGINFCKESFRMHNLDNLIVQG